MQRIGVVVLFTLPFLILAGCRRGESAKPEPEGEPAPPDVYALPAGPEMEISPVTKVREAAARLSSTNNLKQIGLSIHCYVDAMNQLPPAGFGYDIGGQPKPNLSWRVALLPYIEQSNLYNEFHLNEPWDSPHNKSLIPRMPKTYQLPGRVTEVGVCYYRLLVGDPKKLKPEEMPIFEKPSADRPPASMSFAQILDGTSNTILVIEGGEGIIWTKPEEFEYDPKQKIPPFGFVYGNVCNVAFADGSVRSISRSIKESTLRAIITRAGGEVAGDY